MRRVLCGVVPFAASLLLCVPTFAQGTLDQAIAAKFPLTKATADRSDIVTAGSVMVLKKDGLLMNATGASVKAQETYKDGRIQMSAMTKMSSFGGIMGHGSAGVAHRAFVAGEKVWLIDVQTAPDGVVLQFLSDAIGDVRYTAFLKFPFPKGQPSAQDQVIGQISQVMDAQASDTGSQAAAPAPAAAPPPVGKSAPLPAPMPDIAPPPPPPDQAAVPPPTLEKGQTKDQVVAMFGQPTRVVKLGAKEIDYYKDMKITFTNNKVSNVE
jgi:hypothetical protein